jgi:putative ABC transport system ATP-binding protein
VTKTYGEGNATVHALRGVDLEIRTGELLMLVGPSGCGKTTLLSILSGLISCDAGECSVLGQNYRQMAANETARFRGRNIGFVFQFFELIPALTAIDNVATPLLIHGMERRAALEQAHSALGKVGFDERMMHSLPRSLSGGQQQRVAIARAMVHEPRIIVCDEPTSALDRENGHAVMNLMLQFALREDRALVVVTHDTRIFEFAHCIARMEDGRVTGIERPRQMNSHC